MLCICRCCLYLCHKSEPTTPVVAAPFPRVTSPPRPSSAFRRKNGQRDQEYHRKYCQRTVERAHKSPQDSVSITTKCWATKPGPGSHRPSRPTHPQVQPSPLQQCLAPTSSRAASYSSRRPRVLHKTLTFGSQQDVGLSSQTSRLGPSARPTLAQPPLAPASSSRIMSSGSGSMASGRGSSQNR